MQFSLFYKLMNAFIRIILDIWRLSYMLTAFFALNTYPYDTCDIWFICDENLLLTWNAPTILCGKEGWKS